ncbi:MAG: hypothetical protein L0H73_13235 [Nitrococcus sp.]|nr:hypothetical protein [Nitrococcus sp.]
MKALKSSLWLLAWSLIPGALLAANVDWRFPVGVSYTNGIYDVKDAIEKNTSVSVYPVIPVGLSFHPYVELTDIGLGVGASFGPAKLLVGDLTSYILPVGADLRYTLFRKSDVSPYVRGGFRYSLAGGDFLSNADPGFFVAGGIELFRAEGGVCLGIEIGYDASEIEVDIGSRSRAVKPGALTISLFAVI